MQLQLQTGPQTVADGSPAVMRGGKQGEGIVSELQPRYAEQTYRGNKYSAATAGGGVQLAATHLFSTAIGTFTPILAVYNPLTSKVNLVITMAWCGLTAAPLATATQTGAFLFVVGSGQSITNAQTATPVNHITFKAAGSSAIGVTNAVLTGGVGNPIVLRPITSNIEVVTATANAGALSVDYTFEDVAGAIIVAPGSYLGMANGVSNAVAGHLVTAGLTWDETPV